MLPKNFLTKMETTELRDGSSALSISIDNSNCFALRSQVGKYNATILADSMLPGAKTKEGNRAVTFVVTFPRTVLAEMNTHRVFSRNSASSRARSVASTIRDVMENPYVPFFTKNRPGMTGQFIEEQAQAAHRWLTARDYAVAGALSLLLNVHVDPATIQTEWESLSNYYYEKVYRSESGDGVALDVHKQNVNRLLEPYMWHEAVITSTMWENYYELRDHDEADPAIHIIARLMREASDASTPLDREIHAPFVQLEADALAADYDRSPDQVAIELKRVLDLTAGHSAQVSYRPVVANADSVGADPAKLTARLLKMYHMSPFEHSAVAYSYLERLGLASGHDKSNFVSNLGNDWVQNRVLIETSFFSA